MKHAWIVAVVVLCVVVSSAWAFEFNLSTPRSLGMGGTAVGVADDGAAWFQNPAGLGALKVTPQEGNIWAWDAIGLFGEMESASDKYDIWGLTASGRQTEKLWGLGAGLGDIEDTGKGVGIGYGSAFRNSPFSWGVNVIWNDPDNFDDYTTFNLGAMYRVEQPEAEPIRLGLQVRDLTDESDIGPLLDFGVYWPVTPLVGLAVDIVDITDETENGPFFNVGVEWALGQHREWSLRAGAMDGIDGHNLTLGAGYNRNNWRFDFGWADTADGSWQFGGGISF